MRVRVYAEIPIRDFLKKVVRSLPYGLAPSIFWSALQSCKYTKGDDTFSRASRNFVLFLLFSRNSTSPLHRFELARFNDTIYNCADLMKIMFSHQN